MNDYRSLEQKIRQVVREAEENRNTEARRKMANVGRPGGESKLGRQGEIKTKIIDEAGPQTQPLEPKNDTKDKKPSKDKDTVDAKKITGGKTEVDLNPSTDDRTDDGKKLDDKAKKSTKQANREGGVQEETNMFKSDNKFGLPADLIAAVTEAMKGKCPKCGQSTCQCDGDVKEELKGGQKKLDKNHNGKLDKQDFKMIRKEEAEGIDEATDSFHVRSVDHHGNDEMHGTHSSLDSAMSAAKKIKTGNGSKVDVVQTHNKANAKGYHKIKAFHNTSGKKFRPPGEDHIHPKHGLSSGGNEIDEATIRSAGYGRVEVVRNGKVVKKTKDPRDAKMAVAKMGDKKNSEDMKWQKHRLAKEETDPGFSEAELARIEEIAKGL